MLCLADEAHGTHLYFGENLPISAMAAGADMAAVSMHKSGGSLTQSSVLLTGPAMNEGYVRQIINLTQTTSGSYLLLSSLDISRRNLALRGKEAFAGVVEMAEYARREINNIGGYYAYSRELINGDSIYDLTSQSSQSIHSTSALPASRSMTCFVTSTTSRLNLEIWEICWLICPSATVSATSSVWSVHCLRFAAALAKG